MRQKILSYKLFLIILLNVSPLLLVAESLGHQDSLRQEIRLHSHILIHPEELSQPQFDSLLQKQIPIAFLVSGKITEKLNGIIARLPKEGLPAVVILKGETLVSFNNAHEMMVLTDNDLDKVNITDEAAIVKKNPGSREFIWAWSDSVSLPSVKSFIKFWEQTGKVPNFIQANPGEIADAIQIVTWLNKLPKIFGVVRNGDQLLTDVSWKDLPNRKTNGYFCFPIDSSASVPLSPYKAGYQFSPDIILPSPENLRNLKIFNALPLDPRFGLTDDYLFSKMVSNAIRKNDGEIISNGVRFTLDKDRGNCAFFSGKAYIDGGLRSRLALKSNFSVTGWVKPTELGANNCILGKGKDFVLKIHHGELTFTVQGVKDYYSTKTQIPLNQWSFISLVHSVSDNCISFYLNGKLTEKIGLLTPYLDSDYTLLIGSNLWEEYFVGYFSEIKIWERELNQDEIGNEYLSGNNAKQPISSVWVLWLMVVLGGSGFFLWRQFFRKRRVEINQMPKPGISLAGGSFPSTETGEATEQICCFGGLKVIGGDRKEVSKKFSPKIKQLFVLILLNSIGGRKGIGSKELSDCLWPGMNPQNTKNIRGTNIQNLKALLATCAGIKLVFQDKLWLLEIVPGYFIDYAFVDARLNEPDVDDVEVLANKLPELLSILKKGTLFQNMDESWVDPYVDRMSNQIIEYGLNLFRLLSEEKHAILLLEVAEVISINDPLNESALRKKINILTRQGKLSLAHSVFDNFAKLYFELYRERYSLDFKSLIGSETALHNR